MKRAFGPPRHCKGWWTDAPRSRAGCGCLANGRSASRPARRLDLVIVARMGSLRSRANDRMQTHT